MRNRVENKVKAPLPGRYCKFYRGPWWRVVFSVPRCKYVPGQYRICEYSDNARECENFRPKHPSTCRFYYKLGIGREPICSCKDGSSWWASCISGPCNLYRRSE